MKSVRRELDASLITACILAAVFFSPYHIMSARIPCTWTLLEKVASVVCVVISGFRQQRVFFGQTVLGLPAIACFFSLWAAIALMAKKTRWKRNVFAIILCTALFLLNAFLFSLLPIGGRRPISRFFNGMLTYQLCTLVILEMIPLCILMRGTKLESPKTCFQRIAVLICLGLVLNGALLILKIRPEARASRQIVFLNKKGVMNYNRPERGKYGATNAGMFGELVHYLSRRGYDTCLADEASASLLSNCSTVVAVNLGEMLEEEEHDRIWEFVRNGSSLLVLGDHTNVGGIAAPLNQLLEPVGISFNFDSALPSRSGWLDCQTFFAHPITEGIRSAQQVSISVGASLSIGEKSKPIIVGKYSFGDIGNPDNEKRAYLGNYRYEKGAQFGEVILVA